MEPHEDMAHHGHLCMGNFHLVGLLSVVGPLFIICVLCDPGNHSPRRKWLSGVGCPVKLAPSQEERMW